MPDLDADLKRYFPKFTHHLKDFQKKVVENVVDKGNTLCIMPTGGGKSLIYWLSAAKMGGITLIVSPLTALITEQVTKLQENGYNAIALHSGIPSKKQVNIMMDIANKKLQPQFIFASPEKFATDGLFEYCLKERKDDIKLLVIDEVHCVSQWGISFRPFYRRIPDFLNRVFGGNSWCRLLALTATLNPHELDDICNSFKISVDSIIKDTILMRSEIQLHVQKFVNEKEKETKFWELVERHKEEKTLVYIYRKKNTRGVEDLCAKALEKGYQAAYFHGEMSADERANLIERYRKGEITIIFATNAFGMGIDIPDIRCVIHFMIPESAEQYYQEIGRAGRDRNGANAYLLYSNKNIDVKRQYFIDASFPKEEELLATYKSISKKFGYSTLSYFDNDRIQECLPYYLDSCLLRIVCKGFADIGNLSDIKNAELQKYYDSTRSKLYIKTIKQNNLTPEYFSELVYDAVVHGEAKLTKPLERYLVLETMENEITEAKMAEIMQNIEMKRHYKHNLLDYFVRLLEDCEGSQELHQEIARYLGMDKYELGRIYVTVDGNHVRSKSEVIICNLLHNADISYKYEERLEYVPGKIINPDFTIYLNNGEKVYWEHVGMLGNEKYDAAWGKKIKIYDQYFPGKLVRTYEGGVLSRDAQNIIDKLKTMQ